MAKPPIVRVGAFWKASKNRYFLKWRDPVTGKYPTRSTDITVRNKRTERKAARLAKELESELNAKYSKPEGATTWEQFRTIYEDERLKETSPENSVKWKCAAAIFDEVWPQHVFGILTLEEITPRLLLAVETEMRKRLAPGSVGSYAATLRAGFSWAARVGLMHQLPPRPPQSTQHELPAMRLVPISLESLERMEQKAAKVAGKHHARGIREYMRCLWLIGGRLMEPLWMHAFRLDCHHPIVLDGPRPMWGWVTRQKNRRDQMAPIPIEFARWVKPLCESRQFLFNPTSEHGRIESKHQLSSLIAEIGREANVIAEPGDPPKFATAKHFRSSFVTRWSRRGMPLEQIRQIVRHSSASTTEKYYLAPPDPAALENFSEVAWIGAQGQAAASEPEAEEYPIGDQIGDHDGP